jgi:hypothetical protein
VEVDRRAGKNSLVYLDYSSTGAMRERDEWPLLSKIIAAILIAHF